MGASGVHASCAKGALGAAHGGRQRHPLADTRRNGRCQRAAGAVRVARAHARGREREAVGVRRVDDASTGLFVYAVVFGEPAAPGAASRMLVASGNAARAKRRCIMTQNAVSVYYTQ